MRKYTTFYIACYTTLWALLVLFFIIFKWKTAGYFSTASAAAAASLLTAKRFADDTSRPPTSHEVSVFSNTAFLYSTLPSLLLALLALAAKAAQQDVSFLSVLKFVWLYQKQTLLLVFLLIVISNYLSIRFCFSWYARLSCQKNTKKTPNYKLAVFLILGMLLIGAILFAIAIFLSPAPCGSICQGITMIVGFIFIGGAVLSAAIILIAWSIKKLKAT